MLEFVHETISPLNLPFTIFMILVMVYWLFVIFGAIDMEIFDADWLPDVDMDDAGGILHSLLQLLHIGDIPVMVVISVMILSGWCFSLLSNHYLNSNGSVWIGVALLLPNLILALFITTLFGRIMYKVLGPLNQENKEDQKILFRVGVVITSQVTPSFGQVDIQTKGAPITINARTPDDIILNKGDKALVFDEDKEKGIYFVEKYEE